MADDIDMRVLPEWAECLYGEAISTREYHAVGMASWQDSAQADETVVWCRALALAMEALKPFASTADGTGAVSVRDLRQAQEAIKRIEEMGNG